jgi:hypothetical protein
MALENWGVSILFMKPPSLDGMEVSWLPPNKSLRMSPLWSFPRATVRTVRYSSPKKVVTPSLATLERAARVYFG